MGHVLFDTGLSNIFLSYENLGVFKEEFSKYSNADICKLIDIPNMGTANIFCRYDKFNPKEFSNMRLVIGDYEMLIPAENLFHEYDNNPDYGKAWFFLISF